MAYRYDFLLLKKNITFIHVFVYKFFDIKYTHSVDFREIYFYAVSQEGWGHPKTY